LIFRKYRVLPAIVGCIFASLSVFAISIRIYRWFTPISVNAIYEAGLYSLEKGDLAATLLKIEALSADGISPNFKLVLEAGIDLRMGRFQQAASKLESPLHFPETASLAHTWTGEVLYKNRQFSSAIPFLRTAIELDYTLVEAHRWLAASYYDIGATGPTIKELAVVSKLAPNDPRPHRLTGLIYKDMESYDAAIVEYREALRRSKEFPDRNTVLRELAECLVKSGKHDDVDKVLEECPLDPQTLALAAESKYARGDSAKALKLVDQALEMDGTFLSALLLKGTIQSEHVGVDDALVTLRSAVEIHPFDNRAHYQLSQVYARLGDTEPAEKHAVEAARLRDLRAHFTDLHAQASENLNDAEVRYQLGITAKQLGLTELAISWLSATLAIDPNHAQADRLLSEITKGSTTDDSLPMSKKQAIEP